MVFSDPSGLDSMPGWLQAIWDATPWGTNSTWTNTGGGFTFTRWWSDTYNFDTSIDAGPSSGGGSGGGSGNIGGILNRLNFVVIDGSKSGLALKNDKALIYNKEAVKKLTDSVIVIEALNVKDMIEKIAKHLKEGGALIGNLIILSHGDYTTEQGFFIGSDFISSETQFKDLGTSLSPYTDGKSLITLTACHVGGGYDMSLSSANLQVLSNASGSRILGNMTWGNPSVDRFDNGPRNLTPINFSNFQPGNIPKNLKSSDVANRPNAVANLGNYLYLRPNMQPSILNGVYFSRAGNVYSHFNP